MSNDTWYEEESVEEIEVAPEGTGPTGQTSILTWVLVAVIAVLGLLLACACASTVGFGGLWLQEQSQSQAPVIIAPPAREQPAEPPAEQPAEPPAEQADRAPAGQQPQEERPGAGQLPAEPGASDLPCVPLAGGLVLAPLLIIGRKGGKRRGSKESIRRR